MNKLRNKYIFLIAILLICLILGSGCSLCYSKRFDEAVFDVLSEPDIWHELLIEANACGSVSEERAIELLAVKSRFIRKVEYEAEYSGIYLVTKNFFPSKEGILISFLEIEPIPLSRNLGTEIEFLGSADGLFVYRLHYYWD